MVINCVPISEYIGLDMDNFDGCVGALDCGEHRMLATKRVCEQKNVAFRWKHRTNENGIDIIVKSSVAAGLWKRSV